MKAAVIGDPIGHSLSPKLFALFSKALRAPLDYEAIRVAPQELAAALERFKGQGYCGVSVTRPHKEAAAALVGWKDAPSRVCGAVNCVSFADGAASGHNTDVPGFLDALALAGFAPRGRDAVVFGAGGAAAAAVYALASKEASAVTLVARGREKARALAEKIGKYFPKTKLEVGGERPADLCVNATPLGWSDADGSPAKAPRCEFSLDMVYGRETEFLKQCRAAGAVAVDGRAMLISQALRAWELWIGPVGTTGRANLLRRALEEVAWS